jgi:hypothetical protein
MKTVFTFNMHLLVLILVAHAQRKDLLYKLEENNWNWKAYFIESKNITGRQKIIN